jgi:hypothetical protein
MQLRRSTLAACFVLLSAACGGRGNGNARPSPDRDLITREEIQAQRFSNAFQLVEALHSNWLRTRGTDSFASPGQVLVYLDDSRLGGVETLRSISTTTIGYIRYYDGIAASARWGLDHGHGVIFVSTRL